MPAVESLAGAPTSEPVGELASAYPQPAVIQKPGIASRLDQIDAWRGFGVTLVILFHCRKWLDSWGAGYGIRAPAWTHWMAPTVDYCGLMLFFTLSGFLITANVVRRYPNLQEVSISAFYRMRFARIAPFLLLILTVLSLLHLFHAPTFTINPRGENSASLSSALISVLTFRFNGYVDSHGIMPLAWTILWTLSVEEMFYLFYPLACRFTCQAVQRRWLLIGILTLFVLLGPIIVTALHYSAEMQRKSYLSCMDAIAAGCLTALYVDYRVRQKTVPSRRILLGLGALGNLIALTLLLTPWISLAQGANRLRQLLILAMCLICFSSVLLSRKGSPALAPLRFLGRYSYEAYLIHAIVIGIVLSWFLKLHRYPQTLWIAIVLLVTAAISWVIGRFFSEPLNRQLRSSAKKPTTVHA